MKAKISAPIWGIFLSAASYFMFTCFDSVSKYLAKDYSIFQIMAVEFLTATALLMLFMVAHHPKQRLRDILVIRRPSLHILRGFLQVCGQCLVFLAIPHLSLSEFYIIIFCMPILTVVAVGWLLKEHASPYIWPVLAINFLGVLIALRPDTTPNFWVLPAFIGTVLLASSLVALRKMMASENAEMAGVTNCVALFLGNLAALPFVYKPMHWPDLALMALGGVFYVPAQMFIIMAYRFAPAALASPPQFLQIVYGAIAGYLIFGDVPSLWIYLGSAIVILANAYLFYRQSRQFSLSSREPRTAQS